MHHPRLIALALALALLLVLTGDAGANPEPTLDPRDVEVQAPPARQVLVATGTWGLRGGSPPRLERILQVDLGADGAARVLPLALSVRGQGPAIECAEDAQGMRSSSLSARRYTGSEGTGQCAALAPLLHLWSGSSLTAEMVVVGPPTADGRVRPPSGGIDGQAWTETEDPVFHALFAPADLALLPVLAAVPGAWVKDQQRKSKRTVLRAEGLAPYTHDTTVHYLGVTKERVLFEFEVVTTGDALPGEYAWTLERKATGSVLMTQAGSVFHGHVEVTSTVKDADGKKLHAVASTVDLKPLDGEAPATGAAAKFAQALALRTSDPTAFRSSLLAENAATARGEVAAIRDQDGMADVTVKLWDDSIDIGAVVREARQLADSPLALDILEEHAPALVALGILDEAAVEEMRRLVPGGTEGLPWAAAFAVPSQKLVLVKPDYVDNVGILAHEYAHVISDAKGYVDKARIGLDGTETLDLAFVDIDGALAAWALEEAQAEVTEEAVKRQVGNPLVFGFALKTYAAAVRPPPEALSLFEQLLYLLYQTSPKVVAAAYEKGDTVEVSIARAFESYSYQTRQLLFPREKTPASVLFPRARALRAKGVGLTGATRVGAFALQQALFRGRGLSLKAATKQVKQLQDDVVLRFPAGSVWITEWADTEAAKAFADVWQGPAPRGSTSMQVWERAVVIRHGETPEATDVKTLLEGLLKPVR